VGFGLSTGLPIAALYSINTIEEKPITRAISRYFFITI